MQHSKCRGMIAALYMCLLNSYELINFKSVHCFFFFFYIGETKTGKTKPGIRKKIQKEKKTKSPKKRLKTNKPTNGKFLLQ